MADQSLSWRRQPASGGGGSQAITSVDDAAFRSAESWRSRGATPGHHSHRLTSPTKADSRIHTRNSAPHGDAGPAAPLYPLHVGKALPHPTTYAGVGNWALTPTDSLPSLPATPSRAMQSMGWNHFALPKDEGSGSRELSAARALLNRRNEDIVASPGGLVTRLSPKGISRPLATGSPSFPASTVRSPPPSNYTGHSDSPKPECNTQFSSPSLRHRDSTNSVASSSLLSIGHYGHHALSHSRRGSQVFVNSPASSTNTSSNATGPGYRVYRPPHLRGPNSVHALKPKVAHYDRVRTPSLRGQSRSPDAAGLSARLHQDGSGTPSEASVPGRLYARTRRLSNLGSFNSSIYDEQTGGKEALDSRALYKKLAASRKVSDASSHIPDGLYNVEDGRSDNYVVEDDVDLSVEDLMHSLTDEYCLSRTGSMSDNRPVVDIFQIGDRLGPGMMHDGLEVTIAETSEGFQSQHADLTGSQLEVVKKLGEGSYAVVYLVKEVPRDAAPDTKRGRRGEERSDGVQIPKAESGERETEDGDDTILGSYDIYSSTLKASSTGQLQSSRTTVEEESQPARHFALKCLCKRDLSDQMLEVQRLEATIHQSIPKHPNIVTLHRTYETAEWLFLILEYCPGQDLFYWLEQANDTTNLGGAETPLGEADASSDSADMTATDATPPSPSILASTESRFLLSARRLRLISRMFKQMCEAVAVCHDRGISHRDIKPENFIVEDTREGSRSDSVQVKLTDFGLAVAQRQCIDFDCGSKPYMAEECRNNRTKWYDPQQSDIWSLGIVLLNLIFHRNPFSEPNVDNCPSFASYVEDPVHFLFTAFRGLKWEAARYLAENVFCDVTEGMDETSGAVRKRISAREFGEWASTLGKYLEAPFTTPQVAGEENFGAVERFTSPVEQSRSVTSSLIHSLQASPLSENAKARYSVLQELTSMGIQEEEWSKYGSLFPKQIADPSSLTHDESVQLTQGRSTEEVERPDEAPLAASDSVDRIEEEAASVNNPEFTQTERPSMTVNTALDKGEAEPVLLVSPHSASTETSTAKRRGKRGARKGRTMTKKELRRSLSVENFTSQGNRGAEQSRDQMLRELAEASQRLAREMSKSASGDSPISDTASTSVSSHATSADVASNASSSFTNFSWQVTSGLNDRIPDRRGLTEEQSSASNLRARAGLPLPPTAGNWRERNASVSSTASSGYFSDVASIYSTASAPAALAARRQQLTSSSSYASSAASQGSYKPSCNRSAVAAASNLDTITEKAPRPAAEKHLDASYLAGIFGGRVPHSNRIISRDKVAAKPTPHRALDGGIKAGALAHVLPPRAPVLPTRSMATPNAVRAEALGRSSTGAESSNGPLSS